MKISWTWEIVYLVLFGIAENQTNVKSSSLLLQEDSESCISAAPETHPRLTWRGGGLHRQTRAGRQSPRSRSTWRALVRIPHASLQAWPPLIILPAAGWRAAWLASLTCKIDRPRGVWILGRTPAGWWAGNPRPSVYGSLHLKCHISRNILKVEGRMVSNRPFFCLLATFQGLLTVYKIQLVSKNVHI